MMSASTDSEANKRRERAKATGDLDKVTDYVEELEMDAQKVTDSMRVMLEKKTPGKKGKETKVNNIKLKDEDVNLIIDELEIETKEAETALRKAGGNVIQALCDLVNDRK